MWRGAGGPQKDAHRPSAQSLDQTELQVDWHPLSSQDVPVRDAGLNRHYE